MSFFVVMIGTNFADLIREYTRTNSTTLTDATILLLANVVKDDFAKEIIKADEDLFGVVATRDLVASSTSDITKREYSLLEDILKIITVEAQFDGTNWVKLVELNLAQYGRPTDEATITSLFSNNPFNPPHDNGAQYDIFRQSLWLYSGTISAVSGGLKMHCIVYPEDLVTGDLSSTNDLIVASSTTSARIPRQFHELWARKVSILWKSNREKPIPLTQTELSFDRDFTKAMGSITNPNQDRENIAVMPDDSRLQQ